jgi:hypothetical protein
LPGGYTTPRGICRWCTRRGSASCSASPRVAPAFEPDHLAAVSTLIGETHGLRGGALLGALWGIGHTISLVVVAVILMLIGASLPARASIAFELGVAAMLLVLGVRSIVAITYVTLFGIGSIGGMALASGVAGAASRGVARAGRTRSILAIIVGLVSITVGVWWTIPLWLQLS